MANTNNVQRLAGQAPLPGIDKAVNRSRPAWLTKLLMPLTAPTSAQTPAAGRGTPLKAIGTQPLNGIGDMTPQMRERMQQRKQRQLRTGIANPKTASDRSAARLASLRKCAAADRSAKRLDALRKCAEKKIVKVSEDRSIMRRLALMKCAGIATDILATVPANVAGNIPVVGLPVSLANLGGTAAGLLSETKGDENPKTDGKSFVPGVGSYRLAQRIRRVADQSDRAGAKGTSNLLAETLGGGLTAPIIGAGVGGLAGLGISAATGSGKGVGAGIGAGAGAALPLLVGAIAAAITKRRSRKEQTESDTAGRATAKYLVPGLGLYDYYKRLGASGNNDKQRA